MTASRSGNAASPCQTGMPSPPRNRTARSASRSSSDPGNVTTPTRGLGFIGNHLDPRLRAETLTEVLPPIGLALLPVAVLETLDDRIRQELLRHLFGLLLGGFGRFGFQLELDVLAHPDVGHVRPAHVRERVLDGLALRVEQALLERDDHLEVELHPRGPLIRSRYADQGSPVSRS